MPSDVAAPWTLLILGEFPTAVGNLLAVGKQAGGIPLAWMLVIYSLALCLWLAAVGGSIGSFLNVVIYRLPIGKNLVYPNSSCPNCHAQIRKQHNLPVLGWLLLRGKCYDCKTPISPRYPLVELTLALIFAVVGYFFATDQLTDFVSFGTTTLLRPSLRSFDALPLWLMFALQMSLATTLLAAALIDPPDLTPAMRRVFAHHRLLVRSECLVGGRRGARRSRQLRQHDRSKG